ncbi:MAG TPA: molybdopterin-dependent oxidoreductase [Alphaproteobacteria bacterium]|jgi:DMSO/TMAO reductase YedYZ molybdopterin-dependent catalytic subunit|nr:molybdopterin-dependent oxidoreductase [Alphaproteobacteria bacterium]
MLSRRQLLKGIGGGSLAVGSASLAGGLALPGIAEAADERVPLAPGLPPGVRDEAILDALPGKVPLIKLAYRPPNYETPVHYLGTTFTPNNAFFVRYHLAVIPEVEAASWRLSVGGESAERPLTLTLDQLRNDYPTVEIAAVCQCSGNRRGLSQPHVPGVQWGYGAMGNAKWKGARLKDILERAGIKKDAVEIVMDGADGPVVEKTPDFVKSIPAWKALDENTLVAYEMNGEPLPHFNGFPARVVVPGWTATYWVKHVTTINAIAKPFDGFWVKSAYRIPTGKFPVVQRFATQETEANTPITEMVINSLITSITDGQRVAVGKPLDVRGVAWDAGYGIQTVEISLNGGRSWQSASLGEDAGRFAFRTWRYRLTPQRAGNLTVMAKATNKIGQSQASELIFNAAGYHNNVMQRITVRAA